MAASTASRLVPPRSRIAYPAFSACSIPSRCAFSFSGDELYGQHVHGTLAQAAATGPYTPTFFTPAEYTTLARLTDVIEQPERRPCSLALG